MAVFTSIIMLIFAIAFGGLALMVVSIHVRKPWSWRAGVAIIACILCVYGIGGFFGAGLSAMGALNWAGSFQWPVGYSTRVVRTPEGNYVVPIEPAGRVQVYDPNLRFLRGWNTDAGGGPFTLRTRADGLIEVHTSRQHQHLVYDQAGKLVSRTTFSPDDWRSVYSDPPGAMSMVVPTRWWLWPLCHPLAAWPCMVLAMMSWHWLDRDCQRQCKHKKRGPGTKAARLPRWY